MERCRRSTRTGVIAMLRCFDVTPNTPRSLRPRTCRRRPSARGRGERLLWHARLKVRGKLFARLKDADTLVVHSTPDEKEMLLQVDPKIYFETDHYKGWHAVLVRLDKISEPKLRHRLEQAWATRHLSGWLLRSMAGVGKFPLPPVRRLLEQVKASVAATTAQQISACALVSRYPPLQIAQHERIGCGSCSRPSFRLEAILYRHEQRKEWPIGVRFFPVVD
jgi:hypothetical protein